MKSIRTIFGFTTGLGRYMVVIGSLALISSLLSFVPPYVIKLATDWVVAINAHHVAFDWNHIIWFGSALAGVALLSALITDVSGYVGDQLAIRARHQLSSAYYRHLLTLPQHYFDNEVTGKIINRLSRAITDITNFFQFFSNNLLQMLLTTTLTLAVLAFYGWQLAILFAILIPANLYLTARTSGKWQELEKQKNQHFDTASGRFAEVVGQIRLVKSFVTERREYALFDGEVSSMIALTREQSRFWHTMNFWRGMIFGIIRALSLLVIFYLAGQGQLSVGDIAMLVVLIQQASMPLGGLSYFVDSYQRAVANSRDYLAALQESPEPEASSAELLIRKAAIEYKGVNFSYGAKGNQVLKNISFSIEPGTKLALVGESGGGKSTISNLLMGLYQPTAGRVVIDGQDISMVSRHSVRKNIATVFQDAALFSGTVRENISYAKPDATDKEIEKAAKAANAHDFISAFPNGYDTEIGERGIKLSGGQKQRISIARALLKDAPILILDEATSSLDSRAEHEVQQALDRLMRDRTTLVIAHRLSTIAGVDMIVTLKDGKVDEIGTPAQLSKTKGIYGQLLALQLGASEAAKKKLAEFDIAA
jgi:ATP-binding cassette subfamily B protein